MQKISVQVKDDHLDFLSRAKPMTSVAELIWNALDADADEVRITFVENDLGGIDTIQIQDNGHGLPIDQALVNFKNLGGSWKREGGRTIGKHRTLHGKYGKGRFRSFALGNRVEWNSIYPDASGYKSYSIIGRGATLGEFELSDPVDSNAAKSGMLVEISDFPGNVGVLRGVKAMQEVTDIFALYMRQYPDVRIVYDGIPLDPANAENLCAEYILDEIVMENGERVKAEFTIVEWNIPGKRSIVLCDENGFALQTTRTRPLFRGFSYTAYLKASHLSVLENEGLLQLEEMASDVEQMIDVARTRLRQHFAMREAEQAHDIIARWIEKGIYPYEGEPENIDEETERRIFDIYATHLNKFPDFTDSSLRNKRLMLRLLQELVCSEPTRVARVLDDLISFPDEKEDEVSELLQA